MERDFYFPPLFSISRGGSNRKKFFGNRIIGRRGRKNFLRKILFFFYFRDFFILSSFAFDLERRTESREFFFQNFWKSNYRREEGKNFLRKILIFFFFILEERFFLYFSPLFSISREGSNRENFFRNRIIGGRRGKIF